MHITVSIAGIHYPAEVAAATADDARSSVAALKRALLAALPQLTDDNFDVVAVGGRSVASSSSTSAVARLSSGDCVELAPRPPLARQRECLAVFNFMVCAAGLGGRGGRTCRPRPRRCLLVVDGPECSGKSLCVEYCLRLLGSPYVRRTSQTGGGVAAAAAAAAAAAQQQAEVLWVADAEQWEGHALRRQAEAFFNARPSVAATAPPPPAGRLVVWEGRGGSALQRVLREGARWAGASFAEARVSLVPYGREALREIARGKVAAVAVAGGEAARAAVEDHVARGLRRLVLAGGDGDGGAAAGGVDEGPRGRVLDTGAVTARSVELLVSAAVREEGGCERVAPRVTAPPASENRVRRASAFEDAVGLSLSLAPLVRRRAGDGGPKAAARHARRRRRLASLVCPREKRAVSAVAAAAATGVAAQHPLLRMALELEGVPGLGVRGGLLQEEVRGVVEPVTPARVAYRLVHAAPRVQAARLRAEELLPPEE